MGYLHEIMLILEVICILNNFSTPLAFKEVSMTAKPLIFCRLDWVEHNPVKYHVSKSLY